MGLFGKKKRRRESTNRSLRIVNVSESFTYVEAYKALRTNLEYVSGKDTPMKVIMVTSSIPAEGKSNVSINLAISLAEEGKRVIVIDCDLRKGTLHRYMKLPRAAAGLSSVLEGTEKLENVVYAFRDLRISVLPVGSLPAKPTELLSSRAMANLIDRLTKLYDYVILDTPPVNVVTDAAIISRYADGAVLVVSHNYVKRSDVMAAKAQLASTGVNLLGVVLNMYDHRKVGPTAETAYSHYNYSDYDYGYGYGSREAWTETAATGRKR